MNKSDKWYLASKNDALFIINEPPHPSNDEQWHDRPGGPTMVLRAHSLSEKDAQQIVDAHNEPRLQSRDEQIQRYYVKALDDGRHIAELRAALRFYADQRRYDYDETTCIIELSIEGVLTDSGERARKALSYLGKESPTP